MSVTTAIILDRRRMNKKTKSYPVCLRVTFERNPRVFPIGIEMTERDFNKLEAPRLGDKLRETKENLEKERQRAQFIIKKINKFSFSAFAEQFNAFRPGNRRKTSNSIIPNQVQPLPEDPTPSTPVRQTRRKFVNQFGGRKYPREKSQIDFKALGEVAVFYGHYITKLEAKGQVVTAGIYTSSLMSLLNYKPQLRFADVTDFWLLQYEKDMKAQSRSVTTISMYLRCLRRIFNMVIAKKLIDRDLYPFGPDLYVIPAARKRKKALKMLEIEALFEYKCENETRRMCKELWFFMYLGNGMNVKDMCLLKYAQIKNRFCRFIRAKTVNTTRDDLQEITFYCDDFILEVIARWGNKDKSPESYIFPFLSADMDAFATRLKVQLVTHLINNHMYAIAEELGIEFLPGTNDARHAFATQLKKAGKTTAFIRELIGHQNEKTTEDYFDDFDDDTKADISGHLLPFLNTKPTDGRPGQIENKKIITINQER